LVGIGLGDFGVLEIDTLDEETYPFTLCNFVFSMKAGRGLRS